MTAILAAVVLAATNAVAEAESAPASEPLAALAEAPAFGEDASAREILDACRGMMPKDVTVRGHVNRRSRHGTQIAAYRYTLVRRDGETDLSLADKDGREVPFEKSGRLLDTDVTWSDLAMDFLWWDDVSFDADAESESLQGIICKVLLLKKGDRAFRAWIDRRTGAMLQAAELRDGKVVREVFCTSLKKFGDRWSPRNIEVGPPGAKYRTKIVVEDVK